MKKKIASLLLVAQSFFLFACSSIEVGTEQETESRAELKVAFQGSNPTATELYIDKFNETNADYYAVFIDYGLE